MEFRQLGKSGLKVPALCLGTGTFGGQGELFKAWGATDVAEATRLADVCLEAGLNMFDSLNWLLQRPSVATVIIGARNEEQLRDNLQAVDWRLSAEQVAKLDAASATTLPYPYWHQLGFAERNPPPA